MRSKLSTYEDQYIIGKGWITDWQEMPEYNAFRAYISNPTIKKPNKHKRYEDLELISKEDHINLFIKSDGGLKHLPYKRYDCVSFTGIVQSYKRKNGSCDWGVKPVPQSTLEYQIKQIIDVVEKVTGLQEYSAEVLRFSEEKLKPRLKGMEENLDNAGDLLPTFARTYSEYKEDIAELKVLLATFTKKIRCIHSNRRLRRAYKVKANEAHSIPEYLFD